MSDGGLDHYLRTQLRSALARGDLRDAGKLVPIVYRVEPGAIDLDSLRGELSRAPDRGARLVEDMACRILGRPSFALPEIDGDGAVRWMLEKKARTAGFGDIYTKHAGTLLVLCKAIDRAHQAADWRARHPSKLASPVLLLGETGTGKEVLSKAMHEAHVARLREHQPGQDVKRTFGVINCAGLAEDIIESELFGHVKGAYTGAQMKRDGLLVAHKDGTVLLDEIGDASLDRMQPRLLRFLQDGEVRPVGADVATYVYPWLIAATNHPEELREELQQRLGTGRALVLPPLAERGDDAIGALTTLVQRHSSTPDLVVSLTQPARRAVVIFPWPGNLREVDQLARDLAAENEGQAAAVVELEDLPEDVQAYYGEATPLAEQFADLYRRAVENGRADEWRVLRDQLVQEFRSRIQRGQIVEVDLIHRLRRVAAAPLVGHFIGADQGALLQAFDQRLLRIEQTLVERLEATLANIDGLPVEQVPSLVLQPESVPQGATLVLDLIEGFATSDEAHSFARDLEALQDQLPEPWRRVLEALPAFLPRQAVTAPRVQPQSPQPEVAEEPVPATDATATTSRQSWDDIRNDSSRLQAEIDRLGSAAKVAKLYNIDPSTVTKAASALGLKLQRGRPPGSVTNAPAEQNQEIEHASVPVHDSTPGES